MQLQLSSLSLRRRRRRRRRRRSCLRVKILKLYRSRGIFCHVTRLSTSSWVAAVFRRCVIADPPDFCTSKKIRVMEFSVLRSVSRIKAFWTRCRRLDLTVADSMSKPGIAGKARQRQRGDAKTANSRSKPGGNSADRTWLITSTLIGRTEGIIQ